MFFVQTPLSADQQKSSSFYFSFNVISLIYCFSHGLLFDFSYNSYHKYMVLRNQTVLYSKTPIAWNCINVLNNQKHIGFPYFLLRSNKTDKQFRLNWVKSLIFLVIQSFSLFFLIFSSKSWIARLRLIGVT